MEKYLPLLMSVGGSVVRLALGSVIGWLITKGVIQESQTEELIAAIVAGVGALIWIIWKNVKNLRVQNTGMAVPVGTTPTEVAAMVNKGEYAPAIAAPNEVPVIQGTGDGK